MNHAEYDNVVTSALTRYLELYCGIGFEPNTTSPAPFMATATKNFLAAARYPNLYLVGLAVDRDGSQIITFCLYTLWGVQSVGIFCRSFLTCSIGRLVDTAATVQPNW